MSTGAPARGAELLLGSPHGDESDWLIGVIAAGAVSAEAQAATATRAAARMIERGREAQAVALLCACGLGGLAADQLQSRGRWEEAAVLAKACLPPGERDAVLLKWADQLRATGEGGRSVEVLLSLGRFAAAAERLLDLCDYQPAALLMRALQEQRTNGLGGNVETEIRGVSGGACSDGGGARAVLGVSGHAVAPGAGGGGRSTTSEAERDVGVASQRAYLEYSAYLARLGLPTLAQEYVRLAAAGGAGGDGALSMDEAEQMHSQYVTVQKRLEGTETAL